jgi:hypothetical protein
MTVLIKYCGGCNPWYDRLAFVERLRREFPGAALLYPGHERTEADILLVVCGCPAKCASYSGLHGRLGTILVSSQEEYGSVTETLKNLTLRAERR